MFYFCFRTVRFCFHVGKRIVLLLCLKYNTTHRNIKDKVLPMSWLLPLLTYFPDSNGMLHVLTALSRSAPSMTCTEGNCHGLSDAWPFPSPSSCCSMDTPGWPSRRRIQLKNWQHTVHIPFSTDCRDGDAVSPRELHSFPLNVGLKECGISAGV